MFFEGVLLILLEMCVEEDLGNSGCMHMWSVGLRGTSLIARTVDSSDDASLETPVGLCGGKGNIVFYVISVKNLNRCLCILCLFLVLWFLIN